MRHVNFIIILFLAGLAILPFSASALTVSPPRIEITGDPGHTITGNYTLINEEANTRTFYSSFANFEASGESGVPKFLETQEGLATWMETLPQITLKPREEREVLFSIKIPKNAESGGHFAAIFWSTSPPRPTAGGGVSIGGKIGILVLLRVSGEVKGVGGLLEFAAKDKKRLFSSLPIEFIWRFRNDGGNRVQPEGNITIKNTFGLIAAKLPANKNLGGVLPASVRKFDVPWLIGGAEDTGENNPPGFFTAIKREWSEFRFGWYIAKLNLAWDGAKQTANSSYSFFVVPWQLLVVIAIILGGIGFLGKLGLKKYNRWIVSKALQQWKK